MTNLVDAFLKNTTEKENEMAAIDEQVVEQVAPDEQLGLASAIMVGIELGVPPEAILTQAYGIYGKEVVVEALRAGLNEVCNGCPHQPVCETRALLLSVA